MILAKEGLKATREVSQAWPILIPALIGVPIGSQILITSSERLLRTIIVIPLMFFSLLLLWNVNLKLKRGRFGSATIGLLGGFLCGSIGLTGPPMALLLCSQEIMREKFRMLIVIFLTVIGFLTFFYFIWVGLISIDMIVLSLKLLPAMVLGFVIGNSLFGMIEEASFRRMALGVCTDGLDSTSLDTLNHTI
jgi:uncharacterized protein